VRVCVRVPRCSRRAVIAAAATAPKLPSGLNEALDALEGSDALREGLGARSFGQRE